MKTTNRKKRLKTDSDERRKPISGDGLLTPSATIASPSDRCWKCKGKGVKFQKSTRSYDGPPCKVCNGEGIRKRSKRSKVLACAPGKILNLRGYPEDHSLRKIFPSGFSGPRAVWGSAANSRHLRHDHLDNRCDGGGGCVDNDDNDSHAYAYDGLPNNLRPHEGEVVGSLGCGDWRIYQIADGNKLTVDDFVCAWVAAEEMRKRGYGAQLHRKNVAIISCNDDGRSNEGQMFGGRHNKEKQLKNEQFDGTNQHNFENNNHRFNHADIGTGCGSVLMICAWAFLGEIRSIGVEAQSISFDCLRRGLEWNLGRDGTSSKDVVQIRQNDLRTWDGCGVSDPEVSKGVATAATSTGDGKNDQSPCIRAPYRLITGTPPYFPLDSFVGSQNHEQKVRCRVPTRGGAPDYIEAASRFLTEEKCNKYTEVTETVNNVNNDCPIVNISEGVFCMVEAAFDKAEAGVLDAVKKFNMRVRRRVDVVTRFGLPPRFSCWVMTKKYTSKTNEEDSFLAFNDGSNGKEVVDNENAEKNEEKNNDGCDTFPIETFILRNADLTRTKEYTNAMEIMGWVDFEKSKSKTDKSMQDITIIDKEEKTNIKINCNI